MCVVYQITPTTTKNHTKLKNTFFFFSGIRMLCVSVEDDEEDMRAREEKEYLKGNGYSATTSKKEKKSLKSLNFFDGYIWYIRINIYKIQ